MSIGFPLCRFREIPLGVFEWIAYLCTVNDYNGEGMKKIMVISVSSLLLLTSCGTYTASGAYAGGTFGSIIGSAIGGIAGGHRGSDIGTLIGMAGGAVVGAAVGSAADKAQQQRYEDYRASRQQRAVESRQASSYQDHGEADDRLYGFDENFNTPKNYAGDTSCDLHHGR